MKKLVIFFGIILFFSSLASAKIQVLNSSFETNYLAGSNIKGILDVSISEEYLDTEVKSNSDEKISLGDFLDLNGAAYDCNPTNCLNGYEVSAKGIEKGFLVEKDKTVYGAFFINGSDVEILDMSFNIRSNFASGKTVPLTLEFFEGYSWNYADFTASYSEEESSGCLNYENLAEGPLIGKSSYCEIISIRDSPSLMTKAILKKDGDKKLKLTLYTADSSTELSSCKFDPNTADGCEINAESGEIFSSGDYYLCISAENESTNHRIYQDTSEPNCGFVFSKGAYDFDKDYALSAKVRNYADAVSVSSSKLNFSKIVNSANNFIRKVYQKDCTYGCVLPFKISGVPQNFYIKDINIEYTDDYEDRRDNQVYLTKFSSPKIYFDGLLDLSLTEFEAKKSGSYTINFGDVKVIDEKIDVVPAPIIKSLTPLNPPAGIPVKFSVAVDFNSSKDLSYHFDFGDGESADTINNSVFHSYSKIDNYFLNVKVSSGNVSRNKTFEINVTSPKEAIDAVLQIKQSALNSTYAELNLINSWYKEDLKKILNLDFYSSELIRLNKLRQNLTNETILVLVVEELYGLEIPSGIYISESTEFPFLTEIDEINPGIIDSYTNLNHEYLDEYKNSILYWQTQNVFSKVKMEVVSLLESEDYSTELLRAYTVKVTPKEFESYLVIGTPNGTIFFSENVDAKYVDDSTLIVLNPDTEKTLNFYILNSVELISFFVSPSLENLAIDPTITLDESCDFDNVCEEENGEDTKTCRNDCKPAVTMVLFIILAMIIVLIVYTILQLWYKYNYEGYLFQDRRQLYNLVMYITNARVRGVKDSDIAKELKRQGWSTERVDYAMKKSLGKTVGLVEIIPIEKIFSISRHNKARKAVATNRQQHPEVNFNKPRF